MCIHFVFINLNDVFNLEAKTNIMALMSWKKYLILLISLIENMLFVTS